jgi:hypothetical protein
VFFNLAVNESTRLSVPVTAGELVVIKSLLQYTIPYARLLSCLLGHPNTNWALLQVSAGVERHLGP